MRKLLLLAAAIVLFGAVAMLVVILGTGGSGSVFGSGPAGDAAAGPGAGSSAAGPLPPLPVRPTPDMTGFGVGTAGPSEPVPNMLPAPPKAAAGSWEAVERTRPRALGAVGAAVMAAIAELQPEISACFGQPAQEKHALEHYTMTQDHAPLQDAGSTVLVLQIETLDDQARIVDAPVETMGGASDGLVACAQQVLRGHTVQVAGAKAGKRYRVPHVLSQ